MSYLGNQPGVGSFIVSTERFDGTGACTQFTITQTGIQDANVVDVIVSNIPQDPTNSYSITNGVITFTEAPPTGTQNIIVRYRATTVITYSSVSGTQITDGTISASKLVSGTLPSAIANSSSSYANGAFLQANAVFTQSNTYVWPTANSAALYANSGFAVANSGSIYANSSFLRANTPDAIANSAAIYANGAFTQANTAASTGKAIAMSIVFG